MESEKSSARFFAIDPHCRSEWLLSFAAGYFTPGLRTRRSECSERTQIAPRLESGGNEGKYTEFD